MEWKYSLVYLFPPFDLIMTALQNLLLEEVMGLMVVSNLAYTTMVFVGYEDAK